MCGDRMWWRASGFRTGWTTLCMAHSVRTPLPSAPLMMRSIDAVSGAARGINRRHRAAAFGRKPPSALQLSLCDVQLRSGGARGGGSAGEGEESARGRQVDWESCCEVAVVGAWGGLSIVGLMGGEESRPPYVSAILWIKLWWALKAWQRAGSKVWALLQLGSTGAAAEETGKTCECSETGLTGRGMRCTGGNRGGRADGSQAAAACVVRSAIILRERDVMLGSDGVHECDACPVLYVHGLRRLFAGGKLHSMSFCSLRGSNTFDAYATLGVLLKLVADRPYTAILNPLWYSLGLVEMVRK
eukprot:1965967-Rhodomonas_salina.1